MHCHVFGAELSYVLWFFFIFSFLGVLVEMIFCYAQEGVMESRLGVRYLPLSPLGRLTDRLVPDSVLINTFPRMSLVLDYLALTGLQRKWLRVKLQLGRPSAIHRRMRDRAAEAG